MEFLSMVLLSMVQCSDKIIILVAIMFLFLLAIKRRYLNDTT
jgi:hypothetical protein